MATLLALQEVDAQIYNLQQEIKDIPARKQQEMERLRAGQDQLAAAQAEYRAFQTRVADCELQVQSNNDRVTKLKQQQLTLKSNKEFRAMAAEINNVLHEIETLEGQQIVAMDAVALSKSRLTSAEARMSEAKAEVDRIVSDLDKRVAMAQERLDALASERDEAVKLVPANNLRVYERLRVSRRPTIVRLNDGVCGGCHLKQPPSVNHLVHRDNALVTCQMCGRLLYSERELS